MTVTATTAVPSPVRFRLLRRLMKWGLLGAVAGAAALAVAVVAVDFPEEWLAAEPADPVRILDREGRPLRETLTASGVRRRWVPLDRVSPDLVAAIIAVEDHRFRSHPGVDVAGIGRAAWANLLSGRIVAGGSTITQQVVRLVHPVPRGWGNKAMEALRALRLERRLTKDEILDQYVNRAPFGNNTSGVEAAAQLYFGKPADQIGLAESAFLAGLPQSPGGFNPYRRFDRAKARQAMVLRRMVETGVLDESRAAAALAEPLKLLPRRPAFQAPHFTQLVLSRLAGSEAATVGTEPGPPRAGSGTGTGATLRTTVDLALQEDVETLVADHVRRLGEMTGGRPPDAAVVVIDHRTGELRAMVGSADWNGPRGQVDGTRAPRSPGSALKPFATALLLEDGRSPGEVLADVRLRLPAGEEGSVEPRNYDGRFHGPVSVRTALASSLNVPAVRTLLDVGGGRFRTMLRTMRVLPEGRDGAAADDAGIGIVLGGAEVGLLDLAGAYAAFARGGVWRPVRLTPEAVREGTEAGRPLVVRDGPETRVMSERTARMLADILSDAAAREIGFGRGGPLELPFPAAVKTGTSSDFADNWTIGFSTRFTVGVWVGRFAGGSLGPMAAVRGAAPLWNEVMLRVHRDQPGRSFAPPPDSRRVVLCALSGCARGPACPEGRPDWWPVGRRPAEICTWHRAGWRDARNGLPCCGTVPENHRRAAVWVRLPAAYAEWEADREAAGQPRVSITGHSPACCGGGPESSPSRRGWDGAAAAGGDRAIVGDSSRPRVLHPCNGDVFLPEPGRPAELSAIALRAAAEADAGPLEWLVDGVVVGRGPPGAAVMWSPIAGSHVVTARDARGRMSGEVRFRVTAAREAPPVPEARPAE